MKQIKIDVYRTQPEYRIFSSAQIQVMLIRILFSWTMRHPASGYVQGINDLAAPLILVFLTEHINHPNLDNIYVLNEKDIEEIDPESLIQVEADTFWCLSKLVDDIQDNYTELQPGVHKILNKMKKLIE
jgi:TBC1 domain family member 2